jgi:hypothetical protein
VVHPGVHAAGLLVAHRGGGDQPRSWLVPPSKHAESREQVIAASSDLARTLDEIGRGLEPVTPPPYAVVDVGDKARRGPGESSTFEPQRGPVGPQRLGAVTVRIVR